LKPIKKVGQNYDAGGLGEYPVAASATAIYNQDMVAMAATGTAAVAAAATTHNLGSLNGVFYTDATTSKPTFQNYLHDDPNQIYEVRSNNAGASAQTDVGNTAEISYSAGASPNYVSRTTLDDSTLNTTAQQLKIVGVSRDPDNSDLTSANVVWRVVINEHFFNTNTGV
jgi:hypothetical protein